jgi:TPR repeat protein
VVLGRWRDAFDAYAHVIQLDPKCAEAYAMGSLCARKAGENRKATEWENKAHQLGQSDLISALARFEEQGFFGSETTVPRAIQWRIRWPDVG